MKDEDEGRTPFTSLRGQVTRDDEEVRPSSFVVSHSLRIRKH